MTVARRSHLAPVSYLRIALLGEQTGAANALRIAGTILARFGNERRAASLLWRASNIGSDHWVSFSDTYAGGLALQELGELRESQGRIRSARRIYRNWREGEAATRLSSSQPPTSKQGPRFKPSNWPKLTNGSQRLAPPTRAGSRSPKRGTNEVMPTAPNDSCGNL